MVNKPARADLAAVQPPQVRVKPLEWKQEATNAWVAAHYAIHQYWPHNNGLYSGSGYLGGLGAMGLGKHPTLDAAKAAAQADYEARILAALEPQPDPRDEVIARLVEALEVTRETAHSMAHSEFDGVWDQSDFDSYTPEADAALAAAKAVQHG